MEITFGERFRKFGKAVCESFRQQFKSKSSVLRPLIYVLAVVVLTYFTVRDLVKLVDQFKQNEPVTNAEIVVNQSMVFPNVTICTSPLWAPILYTHVRSNWLNKFDDDGSQVRGILQANPLDYSARFTALFAFEGLYDLDSCILRGGPVKLVLEKCLPFNSSWNLRASKLDNLTLSTNMAAVRNVSDSLMLYMCVMLNLNNKNFLEYALDPGVALERCKNILAQNTPYLITADTFCYDQPLIFNLTSPSVQYNVGSERYETAVDRVLRKYFPQNLPLNFSVLPAYDLGPALTVDRVNGTRTFFETNMRHLIQLINVDTDDQSIAAVPFKHWASVRVRLDSQFVIYPHPEHSCRSDILSSDVCDIQCRAKQTLQLCGCWPFSLRHLLPSSAPKFCGPTDYNSCVQQLLERINTCKNECVPCVHNTYTATTTKIGISDSGNGVRFTCDSFTYPRFVQRLSITTESFLAQAGGIVGLYLGLSWLSVCTLFMFAWKQTGRWKRPANANDSYYDVALPLAALYWTHKTWGTEEERSKNSPVP